MARTTSLDLVATLPGLPTLSTGLNRLRSNIADWSPFWTNYFAPSWWRMERDLFINEGGSSSASWTPLTPHYAAYKTRKFGGRGILVASGALKASFTGGAGSVLRPSPTGLVIGSSLPYARAHQTGTGPQSQGPKSLPKRRVLRLPRVFLTVVAGSLRTFVRSELKKDASELPGLVVLGPDSPRVG